MFQGKRDRRGLPERILGFCVRFVIFFAYLFAIVYVFRVNPSSQNPVFIVLLFAIPAAWGIWEGWGAPKNVRFVEAVKAESAGMLINDAFLVMIYYAENNQPITDLITVFISLTIAYLAFFCVGWAVSKARKTGRAQKA